MPFLPLNEVPPVPHVVCKDGRYWALGRTKRGGFPCALVEVRSLTVLEVAATYEGDAQSRAAALAKLPEGQRRALYPANCICTQNHAIAVANLVRAWRSIDESVQGACVGLPTASYLRIAAIRRDTPAQTARDQLAAAITLGMSSPGLASARPRTPMVSRSA